MSRSTPRRRWLGGLLVAALLTLLPLSSASAHSELKSSDPAEGATVPSPFLGPIVLTFTEHLAEGSKADLVAPDGATVATATVDAATMTLRPAAALAPGPYQAKWTSIADDGDLLRGIVTFTVAAAATESAEPSIASAPPASAEASPSAAATVAATSEPATPGPSPAATGGAPGGDVILPIVIVLIVVAAGAFYLVRRNRP